MEKNAKKIISICILILFFSQTSLEAAPKKLVVAYLGADSQWQLNAAELQQLKTALQHVTHVDYAFIRFKTNPEGNTVLDLSLIYIKLISIHGAQSS